MTFSHLLRNVSPIALLFLGATPVCAASRPGEGARTDVPAGEEASPDDQTAMVTVTATRTDALVEDVPATVSVIDAATIQDRLISDIKDLVRYEPGVSVRRAPARSPPPAAPRGATATADSTSAAWRAIAS